MENQEEAKAEAVPGSLLSLSASPISQHGLRRRLQATPKNLESDTYAISVASATPRSSLHGRASLAESLSFHDDDGRTLQQSSSISGSYEQPRHLIDPLEPRFSSPPAAQGKKHSEFVLRYIPVQGTPEQFSERYLLRSIEKKRRIKCLSVVTMYNEEPSELERTLKGICRNLDKFVEKKGEDAWKSFQVAIVSDGRRNCNAQTLEYLANLGLFNAEHMYEALESSSSVSLHLFESSVLLNDSLSKKHKPLQILFALKEENGGKLDSHRWFFNAFAAQLRPKYTFLLDVGTKPERSAIWRLFEAMERDRHIGGCCGEITTLSPVNMNPFVAAQHFEYKISTVLDKAMESVFGFISVLPGAFSAYRYEAIEGNPLSKYFKQINTAPKDLGPFQGNMYLAEDRILCFEVLAFKSKAWTLRYVKGATAATDVPEKLTALIRQRRRWLNGSMFATVYVIANFASFWKNSAHSFLRKCFVSILFSFYAASLVLTWLMAANFYLMFFFATTGSEDSVTSDSVFVILNYLFWFITIIQIVAGLGNKPQQMELLYFCCAIGYGVFFFFTIGLSTNYLLTDRSTVQGSIAALTSLGTYIVSALVHGELFPVLGSMLQYFFMLPTFLISFPLYSFCNIDDISWGTKGQDSAAAASAALAKNRKDRELAEAELHRYQQEARQTESRFKAFRSYLIIAWVGTNALYAGVVTQLRNSLSNYLDVMFIVFFMFNFFRLVFSLAFIINLWCGSLFRVLCCCCRRRQSVNDDD